MPQIQIELEEPLLQEIESMINSLNAKDRSHAVSILVKQAITSSMPKKAVILCGGLGTRFRPITYEIPKVLMPIQGKPIIEHMIALFKKYGINEIILAVGYLKDRIKEYCEDGSKFGVHISYIEENEAAGTAGPLLLGKEFLKEPFFCSNGDELKDIDLAEMYTTHKSNKALATIAITTVEDPSLYGVADLSGSKILKFVEKPKKEEAPSNYISAGLYIIEPEVIDMIPLGFAMLERVIFPKIAEMHRLYAFPFSGQFFDTGNPERYEKALNEWKGLIF